MNAKLAAFAARAENAEALAGTVAVGDGETFDFGEALSGGGTITVVSGSDLERSLASVPELHSIAVPDGAQPVNPEAAEEGSGISASSAAADKAAELGVDLNEVEGSGKGGKITVNDVKAAAETEAAAGEES